MASGQQLCQSQLQTLCRAMLASDHSVAHCSHDRLDTGRCINRYSRRAQCRRHARQTPLIWHLTLITRLGHH